VERFLREDEYEDVVAKFVYVHIWKDTEKEAYEAWRRRYRSPQTFPLINVAKPDGKLVYCQHAPEWTLHEVLSYKAKEAGEGLSPAEMASEFKDALEEANGLVDNGKFISAYQPLAVFPAELAPDAKTAERHKATSKRIEEAAMAKIVEAKALVENGDTEAKRLDGAYQLEVICGDMKRMEKVRYRADSDIRTLQFNWKLTDYFRQASLLYKARGAARREKVEKAKKLYQEVLDKHKGTEAAKRAFDRLEELERKS